MAKQQRKVGPRHKISKHKGERSLCVHCGQTVIIVYGPGGIEKAHKRTGRSEGPESAVLPDGGRARMPGHYAEVQLSGERV